MSGRWSAAGHHLFGHEAGDRAPPAPASPFDTVPETRSAAAPSSSARAVRPNWHHPLRAVAEVLLQAHELDHVLTPDVVCAA